MKPVFHQGQIVSWKDDRGFGFIKPDRGGQEVFLHISAVKGRVRRPKVGDRIFYQKITERDGKIRATQVSIPGVTSRSGSAKRKPRKRKLFKTSVNIIMGLVRTTVGIVIIGVIALSTMGFDRSRVLSSINFSPNHDSSPITSIVSSECMVKGNISHNTGRKLYQTPGMKNYESTRIDPMRGERWFCSEADAIANGWQKAPR